MEYDALQDLYDMTQGANWIWESPYTSTGYPWNFSTNENPCSLSHPWQGVVCSSDCSSYPCYVIILELHDHNLTGDLYFFSTP